MATASPATEVAQSPLSAVEVAEALIATMGGPKPPPPPQNLNGTWDKVSLIHFNSVRVLMKLQRVQEIRCRLCHKMYTLLGRALQLVSAGYCREILLLSIGFRVYHIAVLKNIGIFIWCLQRCRLMRGCIEPRFSYTGLVYILYYSRCRV